MNIIVHRGESPLNMPIEVSLIKWIPSYSNSYVNKSVRLYMNPPFQSHEKYFTFKKIIGKPVSHSE